MTLELTLRRRWQLFKRSWQACVLRNVLCPGAMCPCKRQPYTDSDGYRCSPLQEIEMAK